MINLGDFSFGAIVYRSFTSISTAGVPSSLGGTPVVKVMKDDGTTQSTAGVTLVTDLGGTVGLNNVKVDTSADATFYASGHDFTVVITAGTLNTTTVVGYAVASFSIEKRSALRPTTAGRTLDVSSGGGAGLDWANIKSPTTTQGLSGTTVLEVTNVETAITALSTKVGTPAGASVSVDIAAVKTDTTTLTGRLTSGRATNLDNLDATVSSRAPSATALSTVQWTNARAVLIDNLDAAVSTRAAAATALSTVQWTNARAVLQDNLDATVSSRAPSSTALSTAQWTNARAALLDFLDVVVSSRAPATTALSTAQWTNARAALLDHLDADTSSRAPSATALSTVQWTNARAALLDFLDVAVSSRAAATTALSNVQWTNARAALLDFLDIAVSSRLASGSYTAPNNSGIVAIKAQTDQLSFTAGNVNANAQVTIDDPSIAAIKAKTDNLPSDPASESALEAILVDLKNIGLAGL